MTRSILLCALALIAACAKSPEERIAEAAIERATGGRAQVERSGDQVTIKTDAGEVRLSHGEAAALPAGFPADVPLPAGYKVQSAMEASGAMIVGLTAPGQVAAVSAAATTAMQARDWKRTTAMQQSPDTHILVFEKGNRSAQYSFFNDRQGGVTVGVQLTAK